MRRDFGRASAADEQTEREAAVNVNWYVIRSVWRRTSAGARRWIAESIRLRGQAETVYFCDDGDGTPASASNDCRRF